MHWDKIKENCLRGLRKKPHYTAKRPKYRQADGK